jgi:hypothetical protein
MHGQYFNLSNSSSLEPRLGLRWEINSKNVLSLAYGAHSQLIPTYQYFALHPDTKIQGNDTIVIHVTINDEIDFIRSQHYVISYEYFVSTSLRLRFESFYQLLSNLPVEEKKSSYCILNENVDLNRFFPDQLQNKGKGQNYGIELTIENYFSRTYFFMSSFSLFESNYTASDGKTYNTNFNGNYIFNLLGTREFRWGKKRMSTLGVGGKITMAGGKRYTPFDVAASEEAGDGVVIDSLRNQRQFRDYFRADLKLNYKINAEKVAHEFGIDLVNVFGTKNIFKYTFVGGQDIIREDYQLGFLPVFYYKIDF